MLATALVLAGLFMSSPRATRTPVVTEQSLPALEVSGYASAGGASLDPAFDVFVAATDIARPVRDGALLVGYDVDGRRLFELPIAAIGAFHLYLPLAVTEQRRLAKVELASGSARAERVASAAVEPTAEVISVDDGRALVAWNAHAFPAIRVHDAPDQPAIAAGSGSSTFEQLSLATRARRIVVDFSDGLHSVSRAFVVFGR